MKEELFSLCVMYMLLINNEYIIYTLSFILTLITYFVLKLYSYKDVFDYFKVKKLEKEDMKILSYNIMTQNDNKTFPFEKRFEKMKEVYFTGEHFIYCLQEVNETYIKPLKDHFENLGYMCFFEEYHGYKKMSYMTAIKITKGVKIISSKMICNPQTQRNYPTKCLNTKIKLADNKEFEIINVHFPLDRFTDSWEKDKYPERKELTDYLVNYLEKNKNVIVIGDYNVLPADDDNNKDRGGLYQLTKFSPYLCKMPNTETFFGFPFENKVLHGLHGNLDKVCESNKMVNKVEILYEYFNDVFYTKNAYPDYEYEMMPLSDHFPLEVSFMVNN